VVGRDWGVASVGTTLKLPYGMTGMLAAVGIFAEEHVVNYGVQFGLNVALN
jgi:hypothetical protein